VADPVVEWVSRRPSPRLRPFVERYCGYRITGFPPGLHRGLPSRHLTFIVSIGDDIHVVAHPDPAQSPQRYDCVVGGLQAAPALISHDGSQEGVAIDLTPLGSRTLLGMPASEIWSTSVECADIVGHPGRELCERLQTAGAWDERVAVCDEVLERLTGDNSEAVPELAFAWKAVVGSGGAISVHELATETGWSRQHLARRFRREFGLGPKLAARIVRFERAQRMLRSVPSFVTIAQVAVACGYYDQAHLDRDFAELAGCPPSELLLEDLPSFQDGDGPPESSWSHDDERIRDLALSDIP
jgi:AraC-like DNA-binding protein